MYKVRRFATGKTPASPRFPPIIGLIQPTFLDAGPVHGVIFGAQFANATPLVFNRFRDCRQVSGRCVSLLTRGRPRGRDVPVIDREL